jgi:Flp pilus assembly protein TadG
LQGGAGLIRSFKRAEDGATLVEFALSSAILLSGVFGIIMISFALYTYNYIAEAAHEGARYASVRGSYCVGFSDCGATSDQISTAVTSINYPGIDTSNMTVTAHWYNVSTGYTDSGGTAHPAQVTDCGSAPGGGCNAPGNEVQVLVKYDFPLNIPFWNSTTLSMSSTSQLVISQ